MLIDYLEKEKSQHSLNTLGTTEGNSWKTPLGDNETSKVNNAHVQMLENKAGEQINNRKPSKG